LEFDSNPRLEKEVFIYLLISKIGRLPVGWAISNPMMRIGAKYEHGPCG
jgi:hypothetical protein